MQSRSALFRAAVATVGAGLCLLAFSGCTDADDPLAAGPPGGDQAQSADTSAAGRVEATKSREKPTASEAVEEKLDGADQVAVVKAYNLNGDDGRDTFELSFTKPISGYDAKYVDKVTKPSGKAVQLAGEAALKLVVRGATLDDTKYVSEGTEPTKFAAPLDFKPRMLAISEVRLVGDAKGELTFGLGLSSKVPFTVTVEDGGQRLVLDLGQP